MAERSSYGLTTTLQTTTQGGRRVRSKGMELSQRRWQEGGFSFVCVSTLLLIGSKLIFPKLSLF